MLPSLRLLQRRFRSASALVLGAAVLLCLLAAAAPATAQAPGDGAEPPPEPVSQLLRLLADPAVASWLQTHAAGLPAASGAESGGGANAADDMGPLQAAVTTAKNRLHAFAEAARALPDETAYALTIWQFSISLEDTLWSLLFVGVFLSAGALAELAFRGLTRRVRRRVTSDPTCDPAIQLGRTVARGVLDLVGVGVFALFSLGLFLLFDWHQIVELLVFSLLVAFLIVRLAQVVATFLLAPRYAALRLIRVDDGLARCLRGWVLALTGAAAGGWLFLAALDDLGFFRASGVLIGAAVGLVVTGLAIALVWRTRDAMSRSLRGSNTDADAGNGDGGPPRLRATLAELWPIAATLYLLITWGAAVLGAHALAATLLLLVAVPLADAVLQAIVRSACAATQSPACRHAAEADPDTGSIGYDGKDTAMATATAPARPDEPPVFPVARRAVRAIILLAGMIALVQAWGYDISALAQAGGTSAAIMEAVFNVVVTLLLADLVWYGTKTAIDRKLAALGAGSPIAPSEGGEGGGVAGPGARERTLLPLIRNFIMVVLAVMTTLIVLSSIGVDIGPLLAGAGVIGLAIGFGAQTLVRDIVAGIFFLLEDAFRVGEYVEIGELRGTVEAISLRSMKLRHHRGQVHTLPFGEIPSLTNYSRDWIIMKLEFRVPFDTDLLKFKKLVKKVGAELAEHPEYGQHILEPVKSQGVRRMEEFNMVVGVKFMTKPGEQWVIRRETYQRILTAMEAAGIRLASRTVQVEVTGPGTTGLDGDPRLAERVREAAAAAAEPAIAPVGPPAPVPDTP